MTVLKHKRLTWTLCLLISPIIVLAIMPHIPSFPLGRGETAALLGAIFGALLGSATTTIGIFVTDVLRERRNRDHQRRIIHYNSIVKLQRQINTVRATMEDNVSIIKSIIGAIDVGLPTFQRLIVIDVDETPFQELYDLELINMLHQFYYEVRRFNLDAENLTRVLDALDEMKMSGKISAPEYEKELSVIKPNVDKVRQLIMYKLEHDVMDIIAYVRICADRDASIEMQKRFQRMQKDRVPITEEDLNMTKHIIELEIKTSEEAGKIEQEEMAKL